METIRQARATALLHFIHFLHEMGAPTESALRQAKLPVLIAERPHAWVASQCYGQFIEHMARSQGIEDLGFRVGLDAGFDAWSPILSSRLIQSPTLYHGLTTLSAHCHRQVSHMRLWLQPHGGAVRLHRRSNIGIGLPGHDQDTWFSIQALVAIIRQFAGLTWCPVEILVTSRDVCGPIVAATYPETHVICAQATDAITIPRHLLYAPRRTRPGQYPLQTMTSGILEYASDFAASLRQILEPYILDGYPDISFIAAISGCSVRVLQRRLAEFGTTYSKTVERVRFEAALRAIEDTDRKLIDIAMDLGYADQSAFTRAFRRWAGVSPRAFRRARHAPAEALSSHVI